MQGWEHFQERAQWNAIPWDYPQVWNYFRGYSTCSEPLETKKAADTTTQPAQKMHKTWQNQWQPDIHTCFLLKENGRNRKEEWKAGNTSRKEPSGMPFREITPKFEVILGVFDMLGTPGNKKGSWHNHPTSPENRQHDKFNDNQTYTHASCWKEDGRNRKEECKAGNTSRREPSGMPGAPGGGAKSPIAAGDGSIWQNWENGEVREPNGYCSQPDEFDSRNHLCSQGLQRCRQYIYQVACCCYQCFHQKLFRNNCLAFDPSLDNYFHGVWPR